MPSCRAALLSLTLAAGVAHAQAPAALPSPPPAPTAPASPAEPLVQRSVIEDDGARVDELRVRGQVRRIVVQPKGERAARYEIVPADGARDMADGAASGRGAAGQRVWTLLAF